MVWQSRTTWQIWRAGRTAIAPVLKTGVRKDLGVRIPRSPLQMSGYSVYILFSTSRDKTYVGQTRELALRLDQHNAGKVRFTKPFRPWVLIHSEQCSSREEALDRECWFKSGAGRRRITRILSQLNVESARGLGVRSPRSV